MDSPFAGSAAPQPAVLSAVDSISPALNHTKRQLFAPFRRQRWLRLAVICMVIGDFAGGGGAPTNGFNFSPTGMPGGNGSGSLRNLHWGEILPWLPWILAGVALILLLVLLWIYFASIYRFVLFDSVLHDRCELKGSWRRWESCGRSLFYWFLAFAAVFFTGQGLVLGVPLAVAWRAGLFHHPGEHLAVLIVGGVALLLLLIAFSVCGAVIGLFAKDFCLPIMAMENVGVMEAWRRLLPMLSSHKGSYALYVLMKIVLAMASAVIFGIITVVAMIFVVVVLGIVAVIGFFGGKALGLTLNLATISTLVVLGGGVLTGIFYLIALISTPAMVFFQSYTLHFFGSRYPVLGAVMFPPPEAPPQPLPGAGPELEPSIG